MEVRSLDIPEVKLITPQRHQDDRGFFSEVYNAKALAAHGIDHVFVQDNHSLSVEVGTVRGLHFQSPPQAVTKLVRVVKGTIFDVAVDLRVGSPTFGRHVSVVLSADNWSQLLVPEGFAHGFSTLQPQTEVVYKVTGYWSPEHDKGLRWNDPQLGIPWPVTEAEAILSDKDRSQPLLSDLPTYFTYAEEGQ